MAEFVFYCYFLLRAFPFPMCFGAVAKWIQLIRVNNLLVRSSFESQYPLHIDCVLGSPYLFRNLSVDSIWIYDFSLFELTFQSVRRENIDIYTLSCEFFLFDCRFVFSSFCRKIYNNLIRAHWQNSIGVSSLIFHFDVFMEFSPFHGKQGTRLNYSICTVFIFNFSEEKRDGGCRN